MANTPKHHTPYRGGPMHPPKLVLAAVILGSTILAWPTTSGAQAPSDRPAGSPGRFLMQPAEGGVLRLDSQTGSISFCKRAQEGWACTLVPDDRRALEDEAARLKVENDELRSALLRLEELMGVGDGPKSKSKLPTEQDIDQAADYVRSIMKKLKEKVREFEKDLGDEPPKRT